MRVYNTGVCFEFNAKNEHKFGNVWVWEFLFYLRYTFFLFKLFPHLFSKTKRTPSTWENKIYKNIKKIMKCRIATYTTGKVFYINKQILKTLRNRNSNLLEYSLIKMKINSYLVLFLNIHHINQQRLYTDHLHFPQTLTIIYYHTSPEQGLTAFGLVYRTSVNN